MTGVSTAVMPALTVEIVLIIDPVTASECAMAVEFMLIWNLQWLLNANEYWFLTAKLS